MLKPYIIEDLMKMKFKEIGVDDFPIATKAIIDMLEEEISTIDEEGEYDVQEVLVYEGMCYTVEFHIEICIMETEFTYSKNASFIGLEIIDSKPYVAEEFGFL